MRTHARTHANKFMRHRTLKNGDEDVLRRDEAACRARDGSAFHRSLRLSGVRSMLFVCLILFMSKYIAGIRAHPSGATACDDPAVAARYPGAETIVAPVAMHMRVGFDDRLVACVGIIGGANASAVPDDVRGNASFPSYGFWGPQGAARDRVLGALRRGGGERAARAFIAPYDRTERIVRFVFLKERTAERELVTTMIFHAASYLLLLFRSLAGLPPPSYIPRMATLFNTMPCEFRYCANQASSSSSSSLSTPSSPASIYAPDSAAHAPHEKAPRMRTRAPHSNEIT